MFWRKHFGETQDDALVCTLLPNATVTISYTKTAHNGSIPPGETSHFVNTAKIVYANLTDTATVTVRGPQTEADLKHQSLPKIMRLLLRFQTIPQRLRSMQIGKTLGMLK